MTCSHLIPILVPFFWLYYLLLSTFHLPHATSVSFDFDFSHPGGYNAANISLQGDAYFHNQFIELTKNDRSQGSDNSIGRASYNASVPIWDEVTGELASFTTNISLQIVIDRTSGKSGDGMAFFLAHYPSRIRSNIIGGSLGLVTSGTTNATGDDRIVAVEFDTFLNEGTDTSANHMGIDVNSVISKAYVNTSVPGKNLTSGFVMSCRISYVNSTQRLAADLQIGDASYHVETSADLRQLLPSAVSIGFSAATGVETELHRVLSWSFNSTLGGSAPAAPSPSPSSSPSPALQMPQGQSFFSKVPWKVVGPVIGVVVVVASSACLVCLWRRCCGKIKPAGENKKTSEKAPASVQIASEVAPANVPIASEEPPVNVPRAFSYPELEEATDNFAAENKLGEGGYAVVYKGQLINPNRLVAIKNFKLGSSTIQRRKAFEDEINVISQLKHKNLVELVGWCIDVQRDMLSLVYELLSEGSLHEHLHKTRSWLQWGRRYQIILGLGNALEYLHHICRDCVLRDISASNILLDSQYVAKLADFGLSRLMDHGMELKTTCNLAGTPGYVDPEFLKIGKRSRESDVYGF
ncbi:hypothetical protein EJB05_42650, partial [Eragrostis curvula]